MRFAQPIFLYLLLLVLPLLGLFFFWAWRAKQRLILQFVQDRLLPALTVGVSPGRQKLRLVLIIVAVASLFLALARPQWGFTWEEARQRGLDIIVAIDTSRSMLAKDVAPDRITRAKLAALDLMHEAASDRLGLVVFAGTAFLQAPLTLDEEAFRESVDAVQVGLVEQGGTSLSEAITTAQAAFEKGNDNHKVLIVFTDGEDHDEDTATLQAAQEVAKAGIKIFTVGVGTKNGELLQLRDGAYIKDDEGNVVKSHLDEALLQRIATVANGFYLPLVGANPMAMLYEKGLAPLPKTDNSSKLTRVYQERYHWPLGLAVLCLIVEMLLPHAKQSDRVKKALPPVLAKADAP